LSSNNAADSLAMLQLGSTWLTSKVDGLRSQLQAQITISMPKVALMIATADNDDADSAMQARQLHRSDSCSCNEQAPNMLAICLFICRLE
jgi:hypothetical protein